MLLAENLHLAATILGAGLVLLWWRLLLKLLLAALVVVLLLGVTEVSTWFVGSEAAAGPTISQPIEEEEAR